MPPDLVIVDDALAGGPFALGRVLPVLWRGRTVAVGSSLGHSWVIVGSSLGHRLAITCGVAERGQKGPKRAMLTLVPLVSPTHVYIIHSYIYIHRYFMHIYIHIYNTYLYI